MVYCTRIGAPNTGNQMSKTNITLVPLETVEGIEFSEVFYTCPRLYIRGHQRKLRYDNPFNAVATLYQAHNPATGECVLLSELEFERMKAELRGELRRVQRKGLSSDDAPKSRSRMPMSAMIGLAALAGVVSQPRSRRGR